MKAFSPTILFAALVPQLLSFYQALAVRFTSWENHFHQSSYNTSLTLKTFALSAIVAYMPLGLSAFVYVPFGEGVMRYVQHGLFALKLKYGGNLMSGVLSLLNVTTVATDGTKAATRFILNGNAGIWDVDANSARQKLKPARLQDQMFAYTVTNQIMDTFQEIGLPFVMRFAIKLWNGKLWHKSDLIEKEPTKTNVDENQNNMHEGYLEKVREEVGLPEYDLFGDYSEMVIQFGYVALWSTIWPLAPGELLFVSKNPSLNLLSSNLVMAFLNNLFESKSDAFKLTVHHRRPIPMRTDTMGPWLDALCFLTWLGALTNSALVYLFSPESFQNSSSPSTSVNSFGTLSVNGDDQETYIAMKELLFKAVFVATMASHGYIILRVIVRHIVEKIWWKGSLEVQEREKEERAMKEKFLDGIGGVVNTTAKRHSNPKEPVEHQTEVESEIRDEIGFWEVDEGVDEIQRLVKEA